MISTDIEDNPSFFESELGSRLYNVTRNCQTLYLINDHRAIQLDLSCWFPVLKKIVLEYQTADILNSLTVLVNEYNLRHIKFSHYTPILNSGSIISIYNNNNHREFSPILTEFILKVTNKLEKFSISFQTHQSSTDFENIVELKSFSSYPKIKLGYAFFNDQSFIDNSVHLNITKIGVNNLTDQMIQLVAAHQKQLKTLRIDHPMNANINRNAINQLFKDLGSLKCLEYLFDPQWENTCYILPVNLEKLRIRSRGSNHLDNHNLCRYLAQFHSTPMTPRLKELNLPPLLLESVFSKHLSDLIDNCTNLTTLVLTIGQYRSTMAPILDAITRSYNTNPRRIRLHLTIKFDIDKIKTDEIQIQVNDFENDNNLINEIKLKLPLHCKISEKEVKCKYLESDGSLEIRAPLLESNQHHTDHLLLEDDIIDDHHSFAIDTPDSIKSTLQSNNGIKFKLLPSSNWVDLMDVWLCGCTGVTSFTDFPTEDIGARIDHFLIGDRFILVHKDNLNCDTLIENHKNILISVNSSSSSFDKWSLIQCSTCNSTLGLHQSEPVTSNFNYRLFKHQITSSSSSSSFINNNNLYSHYTLETSISTQILSDSRSSITFRFLLISIDTNQVFGMVILLKP
eukprot:gene4105-5136_t